MNQNLRYLHTMNLNELKTPIVLKLIDISGESFYRERLMDMGFRPGMDVEFLGRVPFSGPFILKVQGTLISLREEEAECLKLSKKI